MCFLCFAMPNHCHDSMRESAPKVEMIFQLSLWMPYSQALRANKPLFFTLSSLRYCYYSGKWDEKSTIQIEWTLYSIIRRKKNEGEKGLCSIYVNPLNDSIQFYNIHIKDISHPHYHYITKCWQIWWYQIRESH